MFSAMFRDYTDRCERGEKELTVNNRVRNMRGREDPMIPTIELSGTFCTEHLFYISHS